MVAKKLIQISDLHLSRIYAYTYANWQATLAYINTMNPDFVINTGDYVLDNPEDRADLQFARQQMDHIAVPWKSLPGDHDIGGGPPQPRLRPEVPWLESYQTTEERLARYTQLFGEDHWAMPFGNWYLIGLNDLIFESGFPQEEIQWQFLSENLDKADGRPTALFMHKPPCETSFTETAYMTNAIPAKARERLKTMLLKANVRLICSGHLHVYRTFHTLGITVVAAPTLMRGKDDYFSSNGLNVNGIVEYTFEDEGVEFRMIQPPGIQYPEYPSGPRKDWPPYPIEMFSND